MKTKYKSLLFFGFLLAVFTAFACVFAGGFSVYADTEDDVGKITVDNNYYFEHVHTEIRVRDDKTYAMEEILTVYIKNSNINTGIIRDIQHVSTTTRVVDGKEKKGKSFFAYVTDVKVTLDGGAAKVTEESYGGGDFHSVKMQSPEGYLTKGEHIFTLSYVYDMSDDKASGFDDFTMDVLGYAMARVESFSCRITFPEGTDLSDTTFRTNGKNAWSPEEGENATVTGNVIEMNASPRAENKGYTVQVILPDGFFNASVTFYWYYIIFVVLAAASAVFAVALFVKNITRKPLETVEFYPPEGVSIMRFSAILHRKSRSKDAAALILKWAGLGLIEIEKDGKRDLILRVVGKYERDNKTFFAVKEERQYFEVLFSGIGGSMTEFSTAYFRKRAVTVQKKALYKVTEALKIDGDIPDVVSASATKARYVLPFIGLVPSIIFVIYNIILTGNALPLFFMIFMAAGTFVGVFMSNHEFNFLSLLFAIIFPAAFYGVIYLVLFVNAFALTAYDYAFLRIITPVWWFLCLFVLPRFMHRRTDEAQRDYGKILGFKRFLLTAELSRLQLMLDETPEYFKDIIPWCYLMGISDKVLERVKPLQIAAPDYIENGINPAYVGSGMRSSYSRAASASGVGRGGGGGGGHGGSSGGGGGGGGSRGC